LKPSNVLLLPGWQNSGPDHWQSRWEVLHGYQRVEQHDWMRPLRGDWSARLEEVILGCEGPVVLVAHSLGCILAAAWASHSRHTDRVRAALLVAVPDVERDDLRQVLPGWAPVPRARLPFRSLVLASSDDPYGSPERAARWAADWGADFSGVGPRGHINAESGLGDWPEGQALLTALMKD
jgi:predicted alpha/beta hydrolase family esterase